MTVLLVVLMVASMLLAMVPETGSDLSTILKQVPLLLGIGTTVVAVRAIPANRRAPWRWLAAAQVMFGVAAVWFTVLSLTDRDTFPAPADAVSLLTCVPVAAGLLGLNRQRLSYSFRGDLLDSGIVTVSAGVLFGVFFVLPIATDSSLGLLARFVSSAYPVTDILMLFLLARMLTGPGARTASYWFLVLAQVAIISADVGWNVTQLSGNFDTPRWIAALWQLYYVFTAVAARSATASTLTEKKPRTNGGLDVPRLVVLGLAASLPSGIVVGMSLDGDVSHAGWLAAGSVVVIGLVVARIWDLLQQVRSQAVQLAALARTDPLTGIANRRTWDHEISRRCAKARDDGNRLYVAILDMDHFKAYNDTEGHSAGDELLQEASRAWAAELAPEGFLARWGGEEFAVALAGAAEPEVLARLEGLLAVVPRGQTCSIGVALWDRAEPPAAVLQRADEALYEAKSGGRNRLVLRTERPRPSVPAPRGETPLPVRAP